MLLHMDSAWSEVHIVWSLLNFCVQWPRIPLCKGFVRLGAFLYLKTVLEPASETQHSFKMKTMDKIQR